jgi:hypothetical protein
MAAEQNKRGSSPLGDGDHVQSSSKKPRALALTTAVVKQERLDGGRRGEEEPASGQTDQGNSDAALVAVEVRDVPQLNNLKMVSDSS